MAKHASDLSRLIATTGMGAIVVPDTSVFLTCPDLDQWIFSRPTLIVLADIVHAELDNRKQRQEKDANLAETAAKVLKWIADAAQRANKTGRHLTDGIELKPGIWVISRPVDRQTHPPALNMKSSDHQVVNVAWAIREELRTVPTILMSADQSQCVAASAAAVDSFLSREPFTDAGRRELDALIATIELAPESLDEPLLSRLPPRESIVPLFIGRRAQIEALHQWLMNPDLPRWSLVGDGGKGKSAIAFQFADRVRRYNPSKNLELVVWMTAKKRRLVGGTVVTAQPDFTTLDEGLNFLLDVFGLDAPATMAAKKDAVLEALSVFPTLLVIDDIDSVDAQDADVRAFFTEDVQRTKARVLFTSRRSLFGMEARQTPVLGFTKEDGEAFIYSKARELGIDSARLTESIERLLSVTEGSPLYVEDLLRLCHVISVGDAIRQWERKGGETARSYALEREIEELTRGDRLARQVLIACALAGTPLSAAEIAILVERRTSDVEATLNDLRQFYLVPEPTVVEDVMLFDLNPNTRSLVLSQYGSHSDARQIAGALTSLGRREKRSKDEARIQAVCRQARLLGRAGRIRDAQDLLLDLDRKYPNRGEVWHVLGWLYKREQPPRVTDAVDAFARAEQLGRRRTDLYWHWAELEERYGSLANAVTVSEKGLTALGDSVSLCARAASAHISRANKQLDPERAEADLSRAIELITRGFALPLEYFEAPALKRLLGDLNAAATPRLADVTEVRKLRDRDSSERIKPPGR